tara:strand:+ start:766 stop:1194 length:429 start_codon:yes stop_codon:yes gene_type:complete
MAGFKKITMILGFGAVLLPIAALSTKQIKHSTEHAEQSKNISKNEWLLQIKKVVPEPICKGFMEDPQIKARFDKVNMSYDACLTKIPPLAESCINQFEKKIPNQITQSTASKWGHEIGQCIGNNFASQFLKIDETSKAAPVE